MTTDSQQRYTGSLFSAYVEALRAAGLLDQVRAAVPPEVAALIDRPPLPTQWMGGEALNAILGYVTKARGLEGVRQVAYEANRLAVYRILKPLMANSLALYGGGPETLFANLDTICRPLFKSLRFEFTPEGPRAGTLVVRSEYRMAPAGWAAWEGALLLLYDACEVKGRIEPSAVRDGGLSAAMKVHW